MSHPPTEPLPLSYATPGTPSGPPSGPRFSVTNVKILGILFLLVAICAVTGIIEPAFFGKTNMLNLVRRTGLFGVLGIGVAFVIVTGGIDLSLGSIVALIGCLFPWLLFYNAAKAAPGDSSALHLQLMGYVPAVIAHLWIAIVAGRQSAKEGVLALLVPLYDIYYAIRRWKDLSLILILYLVATAAQFQAYVLTHAVLSENLRVALALSWAITTSLEIGLIHGVLVTQLRLQPFVVTLCGLLLYRGIARGVLKDQTQGFGNEFAGLRNALTGDFLGLPMPLLIMIVIAILAAILLNRTIWGRYILALGRNEQAARYSGINTDNIIVLAYVICAVLAGFGGILFICDVNSGQPVDFGNVYELYAIAAAVLGGCSLKGGEGSILGVVIGTAVMRVLYNSINLVNIPTQWEFAIIGAVLLAGVTADELAKRIAAERRAARAAAL